MKRIWPERKITQTKTPLESCRQTQAIQVNQQVASQFLYSERANSIEELFTFFSFLQWTIIPFSEKKS
jgi:hypothetical protein